MYITRNSFHVSENNTKEANVEQQVVGTWYYIIPAAHKIAFPPKCSTCLEDIIIMIIKYINQI